MLVMFDLDGTLADSASTMRKCWEAVQRKTQVTDIPFETYFANIGIPFESILAKIGFPNHLFASARSAYFGTAEVESVRTPLFPGIKDMLLDLHCLGIPLGILTSKNKQATDAVLTANGISSLFQLVLTPGTSPMKWKPHPAPLLHAMSCMNEEPLTTLYVGDMDVDHQCARRAGVFYIHASYGYQPDYRLNYRDSNSGPHQYGAAYSRTVSSLHLDLRNRVMS